MKKFLVLFMVATLAILLSYSPTLSQEPIKISKGFKAGVNLAKVVGDDAEYSDVEFSGETKYRVGFGFGGFVEFHVTPSFSVQPEFLYVQGGTKYDGTLIGTDWKATMKVDYLQIPVLLKYNIPTKGMTTPSIFFGPTVSFPVSKKLELEITGVSVEMDVENVKSSIFGVTFGAEVGFAGGFTFEGRFDLGLSKVAGDKIIEETETTIALSPNEDIKNSSFLFMLGYSF